MKKNLYSLMLDDEVVRAVDQLAHRNGFSRSAFINQILAEHLELETPERRIFNTLQAIEAMLRPDPELVPFLAPNAMTMSLKSALDYKYRPTIKYDVALFRNGEHEIGELGITFRTQSVQLLNAMGQFFRLWKQIEDRCLAPLLGHTVPCTLYDGKFVRSISAPNRDCTAEELAGTISDYVHLFDRNMKAFLAGKINGSDVEQQMRSYLQQAPLLI